MGGLLTSPDGACLALVSPSRRQLTVFPAASTFRTASANFRPQVLGPDGEPVPDCITTCCWSSEGAQLVVACASASVYVLSAKDCSVLHQYAPSHPCCKGGVVAACFGRSSDELLILSPNGKLHVLAISPGRTKQPSHTVHSISRHHARPRCMQLHPASSTLAIVGDGDPSTGAAPTVTFWGLSSGQPKLLHAVNRPPKIGIVEWLVAAIVGRRPVDHRHPWTAAFSPTGEHLALAAAPGQLHILSVKEGKVVDASKSLGAASAPVRGPTLAALPPGARHVQSAGWWAPTALAMCDLRGHVSVAGLPGFVELMAEEERFAAGAY